MIVSSFLSNFYPFDILMLSNCSHRTSSTILKSYGERWQPSLVPDFSGNASSFSQFILMLATGLLYILNLYKVKLFQYVLKGSSNCDNFHLLCRNFYCLFNNYRSIFYIDSLNSIGWPICKYKEGIRNRLWCYFRRKDYFHFSYNL